jgi:hypothetical protein
VAFEHAQGSGLVLPAAIRRSISGRAGGWPRSWVTATRWMAAFSCRLPPRLSRCRVLLPDQTGMGATPACMAKWALRPNRPTPPVCPMSLAAVSAPTPTTWRSCPESGATWVARSRSSWLIRPVSCRTAATSSTAICARTPSSPASWPARRSSTHSRSSVRTGGASSGSRACRCQRSRLIIRVRSATRSSRWSTSSRTANAAPGSCAAGRPGSRKAALATANASIGSDLPRVRPDALVCAISLGGTHTTASPAPSS